VDEASASEIRRSNAWHDASEENRKQLDEETQDQDVVKRMMMSAQTEVKIDDERNSIWQERVSTHTKSFSSRTA
jgi:hypothetical protein